MSFAPQKSRSPQQYYRAGGPEAAQRAARDVYRNPYDPNARREFEQYLPNSMKTGYWDAVERGGEAFTSFLIKCVEKLFGVNFFSGMLENDKQKQVNDQLMREKDDLRMARAAFQNEKDEFAQIAQQGQKEKEQKSPKQQQQDDMSAKNHSKKEQTIRMPAPGTP